MEFDDALIHDIDLRGIHEDWIIDIAGAEENGKRTQLFRTFSFLEFQEGSTVRLFKLPNLNFEQNLVSISSTITTDRFLYRRIESELPNEISFYDPEVIFNEKTLRSFNLSIDDTPSLTCIRYEYSINGRVHYWNIYVSQESEINITLPRIPLPSLHKSIWKSPN